MPVALAMVWLGVTLAAPPLEPQLRAWSTLAERASGLDVAGPKPKIDP